MKQKLLLTFALLLTAVTGAWAGLGDQFVVNHVRYTITSESSDPYEVSVSGYEDGLSANLVIPASVTNNTTEYAVTTIGGNAFHGCTGLISVDIPTSVSYIGQTAFYACSSLTSVTIGSGVTNIGDGAFAGSGLTSITIPANVTNIGKYAFAGCSNLATITVDGGNSKYDSRNSCNAIIETDLNKLVVGCKGTTIPNSVTSIGESAFSDCTNLPSITIPASVTSIGEGAFMNCTNLASVTVYATTPPTLGDKAFFSCDGGLQIYVFGDLVDTYQGATRWSDYSGKITAMTNPNGTCGVAPNASDVRWVLTGTSPNYTLTIMKVGSTGAMEDYGGDDQPWYSNMGNISSIVIEDGVTRIGDYAFNGCNNANLTSITIPASVTSIGQDAFEDCTNLASVTFASGSQLTSIGPSAFTSTGLTTIEIPAKVTTIASSTFEQCSSLETVNFATGTLLTTIDFLAFDGCTNLTSITLPNGIKTIGDGAFFDCTNLNAVTLNSNPRIGADAFEGIKAGATVTMNLTSNGPVDEKYWMTFYNENYNFQADANTQVFKAALSDTKVSLTELTTDKIVNKDNAVLLKSTASPIVMTLTSTNSENVFTGNDLNGVSDPAGKTDDGKMYVLNYTAANGVGFYKLATGSKLGVGKAYLSYSGGGASNFFGLDDDGTTSIDVRSKMSEVRCDGLYYDLNGRRVMNPTKGIYIVNGKKIVIK